MERKFEEIVDTEKLFLGCILQNFKSIYAVMDLLNASDFFWEKHSKIYSAMLEFATKGIECDAFKLFAHFQERNENFVERDYLFGIYENGLDSGADYYAKLIKNNSIARKRHKFHSDSLSKLNYGVEDLESIFEEIDKNHFNLQKEIKKSSYIKESEAIDRAVNYWADKNSKGVPTGFLDLDNFIVEIEKGQLVILAASTSMGKSALATNIATNLALMGKSVFFFNFEMKIEDIVMRQVCSKAMIDSRAIKRMDIGTMEGELERTLAELHKVNLVMNESPNMNFAEIQSRCQQKKFESGLDFIVIDYLQLIRPDKAENRTIAIGDICRKIKLMAIELSVPILCLSQLNRDVFKGSQEPELFHLRDSGNIEQDADHVWFIVRKNKEDREAKLKIAKNRNGQLGRISLEYLGEYFLFRDYRPAAADGFVPSFEF
jgi:replicative DNA helicase